MLELIKVKSIVIIMDMGRSRKGIKRVSFAFLSILLIFLTIVTLFSNVYASNGLGIVEWVYEDTETKGDWYFNPVGSPIGVYGSYAHILPNPPVSSLEVPIGNFSTPIGDYTPDYPYGDIDLLGDSPWNWTISHINGLKYYYDTPHPYYFEEDWPYWDEYESQDPPVEYYVEGTVFPVDSVVINYPMFEFGWNDMHTPPCRETAVYYKTTGKYRHASWDDGGERCQPEYGDMKFIMFFPEGTYLLSLYAYDFEKTPRESQEYRIYDETGTILLANKTISGVVFDEGVYEIFTVVAPPDGLTIIVQVFNDAGHYDGNPPDSSVNVVLSGIFVDTPECESGVIWSSDSGGVEKNVFDMSETVFVTVPATGETVHLYVVEDKDVWLYGDALIDVTMDGYNEYILGPSGYETLEVWAPMLTPGSYDIIEDINKDGVFDADDHIDACNVTTGFFVIPELAMGTITALLGSLTALLVLKRKSQK